MSILKGQQSELRDKKKKTFQVNQATYAPKLLITERRVKRDIFYRIRRYQRQSAQLFALSIW